VSAPQPLTGDELATIKARAECAADAVRWSLNEVGRREAERALGDVPRLVAEIERLQVVVESLYGAVDEYAALVDELDPRAEEPDEFTMEATSGRQVLRAEVSS
jgi:hypothetical protein